MLTVAVVAMAGSDFRDLLTGAAASFSPDKFECFDCPPRPARTLADIANFDVAPVVARVEPLRARYVLVVVRFTPSFNEPVRVNSSFGTFDVVALERTEPIRDLIFDKSGLMRVNGVMDFLFGDREILAANKKIKGLKIF